MVLLLIISAAALPLIFINGLSQTPLAYAVYTVSFYTVCVISVFCAKVLPKKYKAFREKILSTSFGSRYMTDAAFKTHVLLYVSFAANLLYAGINAFFWFSMCSAWFAVLAGYYVVLAVMRFLLLRYFRVNQLGGNRPGELLRARLCSYILLLLNFSLTGTVMMILYQNRGFEYHGILIYVMASYTFYITTHAIIALVKYRKYRSPVMTVSKIIALSAALVSMLSLETAMFSQFGGDMPAEGKWLMIVLTGAGVSIAVISMSVFMIAKTTREIREIKNEGKQ